jgi:3-hydroxyacyl-CoA dehydrogenase
MDIFKIGVIGAGKMGAIIAVSSLTAGFETVLLDLSDNILESARNTIKQQLERLVEKNIIEKGKLESLLGKLKTDTDYKALEQADLIIETVPEVLDIKRKTLTRLLLLKYFLLDS